GSAGSDECLRGLVAAGSIQSPLTNIASLTGLQLDWGRV
ncbi:MAG: hypothetical protein FD166_386, partial [Bacteroidetes bacterium]